MIRKARKKGLDRHPQSKGRFTHFAVRATRWMEGPNRFGELRKRGIVGTAIA
jgi:hypothetical protein